jgi:hypothetical protein
MKPPEGWGRVERGLMDENPVGPDETAGCGARRAERRTEIAANGSPRRRRVPRAFGIAAGLAGAAALAGVFVFLIVATPDEPSASATSLALPGVSILDDGRARRSVLYQWPDENIDRQTIMPALETDDLGLYVARDVTGTEICLLVDPHQPDPTPRVMTDGMTLCRPEKQLHTRGVIAEIAPGIIPSTEGPDRVPVVALVPDGIDSVEIGDRREEVTNNVVRIEMAMRADDRATLRGATARDLRLTADPTVEQPPFDEMDPSVVVPLFERPAPVPPRAIAPVPVPPEPGPLEGDLTLLKPGDLGRPRDTARLSELRGRPAYLLFVTPNCLACESAIARLKEDTRRDTDAENVRPVVISLGGDLDGGLDVRERVKDPDVPVFHDPLGRTARGFDIDALPQWVSLDSAGAILGTGGARTMPLGEALAASAARSIVISSALGTDCRADLATIRLVRSTRSGVHAFTVQAENSKRGVVFVQMSADQVTSAGLYSCDLLDSKEPRIAQQPAYGPSMPIMGTAPLGFTRASAGGVEVPIVEGVVLMDALKDVDSMTLTGPAGTLTVPVPGSP